MTVPATPATSEHAPIRTRPWFARAKFWTITTLLLMVASPLVAAALEDNARVDPALGVRAQLTSDQESLLIFGVFFGLMGLWGIRTRLGRAKLARGGHAISCGGRQTPIWWRVGTVQGASKLSSTTVSGAQTTGMVSASGYVSGTTTFRTNTTIQDSFTLVGANGTGHSVQIKNYNLPITSGNRLYYVAGGRRKKGRYLFFRDLTTGTVTVNRRDSLVVTGGMRFTSTMLLLSCVLMGSVAAEIGPGPAILAGLGVIVASTLAGIRSSQWKGAAKRLARQLDPIVTG